MPRRASCAAIVMVLLIGTAMAQSDWVDVTPDATFKGWTPLPLPPGRPQGETSQWKVDPGQRIVICEGNQGHEWLRYDREFANVLLSLEWRVSKAFAEKSYNGGIFVRTDRNRTMSYQAQISGQKNSGYWFGTVLVNGTPRRVSLKSQLKENYIKPAGEWNTYDIQIEGPKLTLSVNGHVTSEFLECPAPRGYFGLEAEGSPMEFRRIRVKVLP